MKEIDDVFSTWDRDDSPGCSVAVLRDGDVVYSRGFGMANLEHSVPNAPDTVFEIASTSKQFTAACIAMLDADGKLSLDDDVHAHVPELPDYGACVTVRHLVHHTGGIMDYFALAELARLPRDHYAKDDDLLAFLSRVRTLSSAPGEQYLYSNSGYFLLSLIVKRASGTSLREFAAERIFAPLGMTSSLFRDDTRMVIRRRAVGYSPGEDGAWLVDESWPDVVGDGGVHTTVEDLARWDANFYDNKLDPPDLPERMLTHGRLNDGTTTASAFGLAVGEHRGARMVSHAGGFAGFRADMIRFPDHRLTVICLANAGNVAPTELSIQVADRYLELAPAPAVAPASEPDDTGGLTVDAYASVLGVYRSPQGTLAKIVLEGGKLALAAAGQHYELAPAGRDRLRTASDSPAIVLAFERSGTDLESVSVAVNGQDYGSWRKIPIVEPKPDDLDPLIGRYYSDELDAIYEVSVVDGVLKMTLPRGDTMDLEPFESDTFASGALTVTALRSDGAVDAIDLATFRAKGLRFRRA